MLILIAESKTMTACDNAVGHDTYLSHRPALEEQADEIMHELRGMSVDSLMKEVKISLPMAQRLQRMIYDFPDKNAGSQAIEAFTGVVFKAFGYPALTDNEKARACARVRIVSSLYGWLRPDDIIKPYRFDFTTPLAPGHIPFLRFWRGYITNCLLQYLTKHNETEILDLMPGDALRCFDNARLREHATVWKADFKEMGTGGSLRTPNAGKLKTLRGKLLRRIICDDINTPQALASTDGDDYMADGMNHAAGTIGFITPAD